MAALVFEIVAADDGNPIDVDQLRADGEPLTVGDALISITGRTRDLLTAERTALNLLCHLSGVATATALWARGRSPMRGARHGFAIPARPRRCYVGWRSTPFAVAAGGK